MYTSVRLENWEKPKIVQTADDYHLFPALDRFHSSWADYGFKSYVYTLEGAEIFVEEGLFLIWQMYETLGDLHKASGGKTRGWLSGGWKQAGFRTHDLGDEFFNLIGQALWGMGLGHPLFQRGRQVRLSKRTMLEGGRQEDLYVVGGDWTRERLEAETTRIRSEVQPRFFAQRDKVYNYINEHRWKYEGAEV